ncbi:MAG: NAD(P)H-quinone oxidoreductase [Propionibacteriaceae bacterium]
MKAIVCHGAGGPEVLSYEDVETPVPGEGEVLITTVGVGVNRADLLQAAGHYPPPKGTSELLGLEVSGTVAAVGPQVTGWSVGDPCVALLAGGGYAEYVVVAAGQCVHPPAGVDLVSAAGLIEVAATVVSNMGDFLAPGVRFLVHGGAGGIGAFAIQYAHARGAWVATTAGSAHKCQIARELGADLSIDYHEDWLAEIKTATAGQGVHQILDIMGAKYLESNLRALATEGRICTIGLQGGRKGELDLNLLLSKRATMTATGLRFRPAEQKAAIAQRVEREVWPMYSQGQLSLPMETRIPLAQAALAHQQLASGDNVGKIVLVA